MYRYLSTKTADYNYTLNIPSQVSLPITGDKTQHVRKYDDGGISVVTASNKSFFEIQLQWSHIKPAAHAVIMDLWHSPQKANGMARTFYWLNPKDSKNYTVRFLSPLSTVEKPGKVTGISTITLRIEGNK